MSPYFNAGAIAVDTPHNLYKPWTECSSRLHGLTDISPKPRSIDQIALPVAWKCDSPRTRSEQAGWGRRIRCDAPSGYSPGILTS